MNLPTHQTEITDIASYYYLEVTNKIFYLVILRADKFYTDEKSDLFYNYLCITWLILKREMRSKEQYYNNKTGIKLLQRNTSSL